MKILIIGFQRSGTTLMRRIIQGHPQIRRIYHESFFLRKYPNKKGLINFITSRGINPKADNWGEKVPFYPSLRGIPTLKYCDTWNDWFGDQSRIIHIVRHPIDVAFSIVNKYKVKNINKPLNMYNTRMLKYVPSIRLKKNTFTVKYENLILNPDDVLPEIFEFCNVKPSVDFRSYLGRIKREKYQTLDKSRVFAYKEKKYKVTQDFRETLFAINKIPGPEYEL